MTLSTEQQRNMLECAAKACGIDGYYKAALESMITKAGEVMRERCARTCRARAANHPSSIREDEADSCAEAIHAIPGVTREDLKS